MRKLKEVILSRLKKRHIALVICVPVIMTWITVNHLLFRFPNTHDFSLKGRMILISTENGPNNLYLRIYGKDGEVTKESIPMTELESSRLDWYEGNGVILSSGAVIYVIAIYEADGSRKSLIKKYYKGRATEIGTTSPNESTEFIRNYAKREDPSFATYVRDRSIYVDNNIVGELGFCGQGPSGPSFSPIPSPCFSYVKHRLMQKDGFSERTLYAFDGFTYTDGTGFLDSTRFIDVTTRSFDDSLAVVKIIKTWLSNRQLTYVYDISNDKWALLTDNPNDRVLYLR